MIFRRVVLATVIVGFCIVGSAAYGHHGYANFDRSKTVSIVGTIERIQFANPHVMLSIKTAESLTYTVEWASVSQLTRYGVKVFTLHQGESVAVTGTPKRDDDHYMSLLQEVRRPSDGWTWTPR